MLGNCVHVFEYGASLADFQDQKFIDYKDGKKITKDEMRRLKNNLWVWTAKDLAPGNLVIRQLCLIDLYKGWTINYKEILRQLQALGGSSLWLESYSYWIYTKPFLVKYAETFNDSVITNFIDTMDLRFLQTAYIGYNGVPHPAPFGDIRNIGLELSLHNIGKIVSDIDIFPIEKRKNKQTVIYHVKPCAVGLNAHIPKENDVVKVNGGIPFRYFIKTDEMIEYPWYTGWDNKYNSKMEEYMDTFNYKRVNTITVHRWWKKLKDLQTEGGNK